MLEKMMSGACNNLAKDITLQRLSKPEDVANVVFLS